MKALVTGGSGFIGSHLVEKLLDEGHQVVAVDDLSAGDVENLDPVIGRYGFLLRVVDMLDTDALSDCFTGVDWVFHLAALPDEAIWWRRPERCLRAHVEATLRLLECARQFGVKSFVYAGSSSCYGRKKTLPISELSAFDPRSPHAATKALGEELAMRWGAMFDLAVCSLRLFHVYGGRSRPTPTWGSPASVFAAQRAAGRPLTLVGDGRQTRDFVHVDDVVRAFIEAAQRRLRGEAVNVGSGRQTSIAALAARVGGKLEPVSSVVDEIGRVRADVRRARERLDWRPEVSFEDGIARLLADAETWEEPALWTPEMVARRYVAHRPAASVGESDAARGFAGGAFHGAAGTPTAFPWL